MVRYMYGVFIFFHFLSYGGYSNNNERKTFYLIFFTNCVFSSLMIYLFTSAYPCLRHYLLRLELEFSFESRCGAFL